MASEEIIQFFWKHQLRRKKPLFCTCGTEVTVISPGAHNFHAGPDFFNARIKVGDLVWAGNVEVHLRASDWYRHAHHIDPAYNNVILHVVAEHDTDIYNSLGLRIFTLVADFPVTLCQRYQALKNKEDWLPCRDYLRVFPARRMKDWLAYLQKERLQEKSHRLIRLPYSLKRNREEAFYQAMASGFGLSLNSLPFELLARGIPLSKLGNLRENLFDLEALYFGHSGLLHPAHTMGPYPASLWERYKELQHLVSGSPVPFHLWKFLRLRPASFPTLRISQFAFLLHRRMPLLENILSLSTLYELEQLLRTGASPYWDTHYVFGKCSPPSAKYLGQNASDTLIINVIVPFLHELAEMDHDTKIPYRTGEILFQMKAESNHIIDQWKKHGIRAENAGESQALLQLFNVYCKQKRCLFCQIGTGILEASIYE